MHDAAPVAVSDKGYYGIDRIKHGIEVDSFVGVERYADGVDGNPCEPLLEVFSGEHPHGDDAQGRREGVGEGNGAVSEVFEDTEIGRAHV